MENGANEEKVIFLKKWYEASVEVFNETSAEVIFRGDFVYQGKTFENLPYLRLSVYDFGENEIYIEDEYSNFIPYLKPISNFRKSIQPELIWVMEARGNTPDFVKSGIRSYLLELRNFSEVKSLIRQAKSSVNRLDHQKDGVSEKARKILEVMEETPLVDVKFEL